MIVRELPNGGLLCIHQTSHALMAEAFCRHWGNGDFAPPHPYPAIMLAISQHDNGWCEWERFPQLRSDGYPMDFVHDSDPLAKLALWRRGIDRVYEQHPYAAVLVARHAALLYANAPLSPLTADVGLPDDVAAHTADFIADQQMLLALVRHEFSQDAYTSALLADPVVEANTRLLQFGDSASLQVLMPWGNERQIAHCPLDASGATVPIQMRFDDTQITFDPWPFGVAAFDVSIHGRLLAQRYFRDQSSYQMALAEAPYVVKSWHVARRG